MVPNKPQESEESLKEVGRRYEEYLRRVSEGEDLELERFAAEHPGHLDSLLEIQRIDQFLSRARGWSGGSVPERIKKQFGDEADPGVTLDDEDAESSSDFSTAVLQRLAERQGAFGRYRIKSEVARGGQGAVLRVWDEDLRRNLAMKVILGKGDAEKTGATPEVDSRTLARFLEEAQVTGQLDHPGIVPVHELGLDSQGRVYFTMKLVKGENFKSIIEKVHRGEDGWTLTRALGVILKVCEAMAYAHSKSVIHRDLKPANVMVGRFGEVYVMDWGLARVLGGEDKKDIRIRPEATTSISEVRSERRDRADAEPDSPLVTMDGDVVGTPAYMSPEQARGELDRVGPQSDVYSVSAMLYHLLTGHMPYVPPEARLNNYAVWQRVQEGPPRLLAEVAPDAPRELVAVCQKAMAHETGKRYADMNGLAKELQAFIEHRVVRAHGSGPTTRLAKFVERNPVLVRTVLVSFLLLVSSAAVFTLHLGRAVVAKERAMLERSRDTFGPRIESLLGEEAELYPIAPETVAAMQGWLSAADELLAEAGDLPKSEKTVELVALLDSVRGRVSERVESAASLHERTIIRPSAAWAEAIEAIELSNEYARAFDQALVIEPQLGLEPLGQDHESRLWEFRLPLTGAAPSEVNPETGRFVVGEDTGIVLVLLPGSPGYDMGAGDPDRTPEEGCLVRLHPFFIGKHEVTQGQWMHVMEQNPSYFLAGREHSDDGRSYDRFDLSHPVNALTWYEASDYCRRIALTLPTEAQWEYACRVWTETPYWFGDSLDSVKRFENVKGAPWEWTAPVGCLEPNRFGLHDVLGNVTEFCRDRFVLGLGPARLDGTNGSRTWGSEQEDRAYRAGVARWSIRGGSWYEIWSAYDRTSQPPDHRFEDQGLRVARPLIPCPLCSSDER